MEDTLIPYIITGMAFIASLFQVLNHRSLEKYAVQQGVVSADRSIKLSAIYLLICGVICFVPDQQKYGIYNWLYSWH